MLSKRLLLPVTLFAVFVTPAVAHAADPSENIQLDVPSQIQYRVSPSGTLISPSSSSISFKNNSDFETRISGVRFVAGEGVNVCDDALEMSTSRRQISEQHLPPNSTS